jgi:hypothetical protein
MKTNILNKIVAQRTVCAVMATPVQQLSSESKFGFFGEF